MRKLLSDAVIFIFSYTVIVGIWVIVTAIGK